MRTVLTNFLFKFPKGTLNNIRFVNSEFRFCKSFYYQKFFLRFVFPLFCRSFELSFETVLPYFLSFHTAKIERTFFIKLDSLTQPQSVFGV